ncbi:MAG: alkaline phosphatase family protein [Nitrospirota bacterium]
MKLNKGKVVVIGIDGATFNIINPLVKDGKLPNIAMMMDNGIHGILDSTIPYVSPVAWTSFMTGKNPQKHQIFDFSGKIQGTYEFRINTAENRKAKPFWMNLSKKNKRVLVVGVTMTYPPDPVNGYMVSGLGVPSSVDMQSCVYPPDFAMEIVNNFGKYNTVPEADMRKLNNSDKEKEKYLRGVFDQIEYRINLFKRMWQKESFDFSMIFFLDTDGVSHYFWKYMDSTHKQYQPGAYSNAIHKVYEKVDNAIGELLTIINDETDVVLVSDHGFGPLNRVVFLNNWLESKGYLKFKDTSWFNTVLSKLLLIKRRERTIKKEIDWHKTKAYFNGTTGNIFLNLREREPNGIVDVSEYNNLCNKLQRELVNLKDPETNEKIVAHVYRKEELFNVKNVSIAPDLILTFKRGYSVVGEEISLHNLRDTGEIIVDSNNWSGTHEPEGIFIARGRSFKKGHKVQGTDIIDIAPTLLYLLGVPIPKCMDGKLLKDIFVDEFLKSHPVSYTEDNEEIKSETKGYEKSDNKKVLEQLHDLGYIE